MEPSLQPSFTFPSRKNFANRALGLQAQINLQQITSKPARATDISLETGLYQTLTVPPTLDKETIDWPGKLPVSTPWYVQPGLAEGLSAVSKSQALEQQYLQILCANNALKRGNYKAAEKILGRPLSQEEIANKSTTPNARVSETGQKFHVGNHADALGTQLRAGPTHAQKLLAAKLANKPFLNDLAAKLGMTVQQVGQLKTRFGYVGEQDFSDIYGPAVSGENKSRVLQAIHDDIRNQMRLSAEENEWRQQMRTIMAGGDSEKRALQEKAIKAQENSSKMDQSKEPVNPVESNEEMKEPGEEMKIDEDGNIVPPPIELPPAPTVRMEQDNDTRGNSLDPSLLLRARDPPPPHFRHIVPGAASSETERKQINEEFQDHPGYVGTGQPIINPGVLEHVQENVDLMDTRRKLNQAIRNRIRLINEGNEEMKEVLREDEAKAMVSDAPAMNVDQAAIAVLDAPKGRRRARDPDLDEKEEPSRKRHDDNVLLFKRKRDEEIRAIGERMTKQRKAMEPDEEWGEGFGKQKRRKRRNNIRHPYDDRWIPDAEGFLPHGAPVSGHYMKRTGTDAIPISAQLQVNTAHQFTELPVRKYTQFPNFTEEIKTTPPIPIDIDGDQRPRGVGSNRGKLQFGTYKLDYGKLMGEGILSISHPNGRKVKGLNNQRVSKGVHHALSQMVTGGKVNPRRLAAEDRVFMAKLMQKANAHAPKLGAEINMPPEQQLSLILGEIEAGNDSALLKGQLRKLLPYLKRMKIITPQHVADIETHYL
jgi:hypothetical protein